MVNRDGHEKRDTGNFVHHEEDGMLFNELPVPGHPIRLNVYVKLLNASALISG